MTLAPKKNYSKDYKIKPAKIFLKQVENISKKGKDIIKEKILILKKNPTHFKALYQKEHNLFRIKFSDNRQEKRIIYEIKENEVRVLCILERKNNYKDLKKYIKENE